MAWQIEGVGGQLVPGRQPAPTTSVAEKRPTVVCRAITRSSSSDEATQAYGSFAVETFDRQFPYRCKGPGSPKAPPESLANHNDQVKVHWRRTELQMIEAALLACRGVAQAAVMATSPRLGDSPTLVAFVVGAGLSEGELAVALRVVLPEHMMPQAFGVLPKLPFSADGKVDRRALATEARRVLAARKDSAPSTPGEKRRAEAEAAVVTTAGEGEDQRLEAFVAATEGEAAAPTELQDFLSIGLPDFKTPTLPSLARRIAADSEAIQGGGCELAAVPLSERTAGLRSLSLAQERIWSLHASKPESDIYHLPLAFFLRGSLNLAALAASLHEVFRRHEILRSHYEVIESVPRAVVGEGGGVLSVVDLSALEARWRVARELVAQEIERPFDLTVGQVLRALLIRLGPDEFAFGLNIHSIACDGWSLGLLVREVEQLYREFAAGRAPSLLPLPIQYGDFAAWQRRWLTEDEVAQQVGWWRDYLAGAPARLDLPVDRRLGDAGSVSDEVSFVLSAELSARLHTLACRSGASLLMVLHAALAVLLSGMTGQNDIVIGSHIGGRKRPELKDLIGRFLNTWALRVVISANLSFAELVAAVRERSLGPFAHQDVPFDRLMAELTPERNMERMTLFPVFLSVLKSPSSVCRDLPGLEVTPFPIPQMQAKSDLALYAQSGDVLGFHLVYAADLFDRGRMEELLRQLGGVLKQAVKRPECPVATFMPLTMDATVIYPNHGLAVADGIFRGLYEHQGPALSRFFVRQGCCSEESRDLVQETFLIAYSCRSSFRGESAPRSWLFGIAANIWRSRFRDQRRLKRDAQVVSLEEGDEDCWSAEVTQLCHPLTEFLSHEQARLLSSALKELPEKMRACLMMFVYGYKYREIAGYLDVSINTIRSQVFEARKKLRTRLAHYFSESYPPRRQQVASRIERRKDAVEGW